jgi:uncharacterized membrane protein YidH (DUF202 family)
MEMMRIVGGMLILLGVLLAIYGINELNSLSSKFWNELGVTNTSAYLAIGIGVIVACGGLAMILSKRRRD